MDVTTEALLASMDGRPKSPGHNNFGSIMDRMPNGMVQVSHYNLTKLNYRMFGFGGS